MKGKRVRKKTFPKPADEVRAGLAESFRHDKSFELAELLASATARFVLAEYDNYNGGTNTWNFSLDVPASLLAPLKGRVETVEQEIAKALAPFVRPYPHHSIGQVILAPSAAASATHLRRISPLRSDVERVWRNGTFRLFLSHVSDHKASVARLKVELERRGVSAFVAHEDVEPSREWQREIETALRSMHALAALITPDFQSSRWTGQEVGWALGRDVPVLAIRLGADPYGFCGKNQAIPGTLDQPISLARSIVGTLLSKDDTRGEIRRGLIKAFIDSKSAPTVHACMELIPKMGPISDQEVRLIRNACATNPTLFRLPAVTEAMNRICAETSTTMDKDEGEAPF